jgi:hypothetical protein
MVALKLRREQDSVGMIALWCQTKGFFLYLGQTQLLILAGALPME